MLDICEQIMMGLLGTAQASFFILIFAVSLYIIIVSSIISLGLFILWIITLVDCIKRKDEDFAVGGKNAKIIWLLLIIFIRNIVPLVYFFLIMYRKPSPRGNK